MICELEEAFVLTCRPDVLDELGSRLGFTAVEGWQEISMCSIDRMVLLCPPEKSRIGGALPASIIDPIVESFVAPFCCVRHSTVGRLK